VDRDNDRGSGPASRSVENRGQDAGVRVHRTDDIGVREAQRRFGGVDLPAALAGTMAALGLSLLLGGALAAAGLLRYGEDAAGVTDRTSLATGAAVSALVIALLSVAFGAWVAGRMARYDGGRNGVLTALLFIIALAGLSAAGLGLGEETTDGDLGVRLGDLTDSDAFGPLGIAGALGAIALLLLTGWFFGRLGSRYHRKADAFIAGTRQGAIATADSRVHVQDRPGGLRHDDGLTGVTGSGAVTGQARDLDDSQDELRRDRTRRETGL